MLVLKREKFFFNTYTYIYIIHYIWRIYNICRIYNRNKIIIIESKKCFLHILYKTFLWNQWCSFWNGSHAVCSVIWEGWTPTLRYRCCPFWHCVSVYKAQLQRDPRWWLVIVWKNWFSEFHAVCDFLAGDRGINFVTLCSWPQIWERLCVQLVLNWSGSYKIVHATPLRECWPPDSRLSYH